MKTKLLNVISLNVIETNNVLCVDTHIRLKSLNYYSTHDKLIKYFDLQSFCDETSEALKTIGIYYRLERIHARWQLTEYIIKGAALTSDNTGENKLVYYIKSVDNKSHLLVDANTVEPIEEYHSQWSID